MMKGDDHRLREGEGESGWRYSNEAIFSTISSFGFLVLLCSNCPFFVHVCVVASVDLLLLFLRPVSLMVDEFWEWDRRGQLFETGCSLSLLHPLFTWSVTSPSSPSANISYPFYSYHHHIVVAPYLSPSTSYTQPQSVLLFFYSFLIISFPDLESEPTLTFMAPTLSVAIFCFVYFPPRTKQTAHPSDRLKVSITILGFISCSVSNNENGVFFLVLLLVLCP